MTVAPAPEILPVALDSLDAVPDRMRGLALAIGNFDGVHRGHQALIDATGALARRIGTAAGVLTFEPHPRSVLRPDAAVFRLTNPAARRALIGAAGIGRIVELTFDRMLASLTPAEFVERVLVGGLGIRGILSGQDFRFGNGRAGDVAFLREAGRTHGFAVEALAPVSDASGAVFSSGRIRKALGAGDIAEANEALGYRWFVTGTVIHGDKRGRELGYPTANIMIPAGHSLRHGIYAVTAAVPGGKPMPAVASFGVRPTFGHGGAALLEVHIFDFSDDLYDRELRVTFFAWIRPEERFTSIEALVAQIDHDAETARQILRAADGGTALDRVLAGPVAAESGIA
ncbi:MAG: bifunctional riboflavin kinase/FAD synthetase [Bauldia sp.]